MQTINGKPSVFLAVESPATRTPNYQSAWLSTAMAFASETAHSGIAAAEAAHHTKCPQCHAELTTWRLANTEACEAEFEAAHESVWENCEDCQADFAAWNAHVDAQAEEYELSRLGAGAVHAFNGDDHRWQNGGVK